MRDTILIGCSNEGIIASIIPLLCPTLSQTVSSINQRRVSLVYERKSHMTGITPQLPNLVSTAAIFPTPGERFWVDRVRSVSYRPVSLLHYSHLPTPLRLHGVQYGFQRRLGSYQQNHWGPCLGLGCNDTLSRPEPEIRGTERWP